MISNLQTTLEHERAMLIQRHWKAYIARKKFKENKKEKSFEKALSKLQRRFRAKSYRKTILRLHQEAGKENFYNQATTIEEWGKHEEKACKARRVSFFGMC